MDLYLCIRTAIRVEDCDPWDVQVIYPMNFSMQNSVKLSIYIPDIVR